MKISTSPATAAGVTSIIFMLGMYRAMPAALVIAVGVGGTFLLNQIVMNLVFREKLTPAAVAGLVLILVGILMTTLLNGPIAGSGEKTSSAPQEQKGEYHE